MYILLKEMTSQQCQQSFVPYGPAYQPGYKVYRVNYYVPTYYQYNQGGQPCPLPEQACQPGCPPNCVPNCQPGCPPACPTTCPPNGVPACQPNCPPYYQPCGQFTLPFPNPFNQSNDKSGSHSDCKCSDKEKH